MSGQNMNENRYFHLLAGTYTSGKSEGIYVYRFDSQTGDIRHEFTAAGVENPSFLTASADGKYVYAVNELGGGAEGKISAFRFHPSGRLEPLNRQASGGGSPCYLSLSKDGKFLFVANYSGGSLSAFPIAEDGSLKPAVQTIRHSGSGPNALRQEKAHVHSVVFSPDGRYLFAADLGTDKVNTYVYDGENAAQPLSPADPPYVAVTPGTGPRHLLFDRSGKFAYLIQELTGTVTLLAYENGRLRELQSVPMSGPQFQGETGAAEIRISPDGKFLYASNRGDANEIVIYRIDRDSGNLSLVERCPTLGKTPRNFMIDPAGSFLLAANQNSDSIVLFRRDTATGRLEPTGKTVEIGNPVYLMMLPAIQ